MKMTKTLSLAVAMTMLAGAALAADPVHSPRGAQSAASTRTAPGMAERQALTFSRGKAAQLNSRKASGTTDRDLVREARSQVYTGKNAPQRPVFEVAPAK